MMSGKIPVIFDTDIGTDIDDTWALAMLLKSPELDVKLILTSTGDTYLRTKITAKLLEIAGRSDIPIGVGMPLEFAPCYQAHWVDDYELSRYPGQIIEDGVGAMIDIIQNSPQPITVIGVSPAANIAAALQRQPAITRNSCFIGMFGSLRRGYFGSDTVAAEYNVVRYPYALRKVFEADWRISNTPLDTCGIIQLKGEVYQQMLASRDPLVQATIENYRVWCQYNTNTLYNGFNPEAETSILYDVVAVYMAFSEEWLTMEEQGVQVTDDGYTLPDANARPLRWATEWRDRAAFEQFFVARLLG